MQNRKDLVVEFVLEYLKDRTELTELESDILSAVVKYNEIPFDRKGTEQKIKMNNDKYKDIFVAISVLPGIIKIPFCEVSNEDLLDNLRLQIEAMCFKEYMALADTMDTVK